MRSFAKRGPSNSPGSRFHETEKPLCYNAFMLSEFLHKKLATAKYKLLKDRTYYGEIPGLRGVWANARSLEACRKELKEILEEWLLLKVRNKESVPGFNLKIDRRSLVRHG